MRNLAILITAMLIIPVICIAGQEEDTMDIKWLGHDTFKIQAEKLIYTDPFNVKNPDKADIILITHEHRDHCSPEDVSKIAGEGTVIVAPADCGKKLGRKFKAIKPGESIDVMGIKIETVPAYNTNKQFHTKDRQWVGYIFTVGGKRLYLAGDTDRIPELKSIKCDIAFLPVSGTYVMTADEAVEAALDIMPKTAIPMHYNSIVGTTEDAEKFKDGLKGKVEVLILKQE